MSGIAGRKALVKVTGIAVAFADEACTDEGAHTIYQITNAAKRVWDPTATITVKVDGGAVSSALYTLNRLTGRITFLVARGPAEVITVSGSYLPLAVAAGCRQFSYTIEQGVVEDSDWDSIDTTNGVLEYLTGLLKVAGTLGKRWRAESYFESALIADTLFVVQIFEDRDTDAQILIWARLNKVDLSAVLEGAIDGNVGFNGTGDADGRVCSLSTQ